jgi:aryl-alcohol dehydrogenase-like predicted oxidoreductase
VRTAAEIPRRRLGRSGPELSAIGLGGWEAGGGRTWGRNEDDRAVMRALRCGWDLGANWIDTAEVYAGGGSEELIGRALAGYRQVRVMSKVGPRPDGSGVRPKEIEAAVEGSLRRLRRESLDLYLVHWRDPGVPLDETWGAMARLVERGLVQHVGVSNFCAGELEACAAIRPVEVLQLQGSLLYRDELEALGPVCRRLGAGIVCYGSLAYGLLSGGFCGNMEDWRSGGQASDDFFVVENFDRFFAPGVIPGQLARVAAVRAIAAELGLTAAQAALAWLLAQPMVDAAIVGSRSIRHIEENLEAAAVSLDVEERRRLLEAAGG